MVLGEGRARCGLAMSFYPDDWPRCPVCGDFALDGHITCGRLECDEQGQRNERADIYRLTRAVAHVEAYYPLPRCPHGNALEDGAGERLEPSCGCVGSR